MNPKQKDESIIREAEEFATEAHRDQYCKNKAKDSFIMHPRQVANLVRMSGGTTEEIAAAWLHDIVEDTPVALDEIKRKFGDTIAVLVEGLTDSEHFKGNPISIRKAWQAERIASANPGIKRIKLADQTVNLRFVGFDPPADFTTKDRLDYAEGAKLIALKCAGVSEKLDRLFEYTYKNSLSSIHRDIEKERL